MNPSPIVPVLPAWKSEPRDTIVTRRHTVIAVRRWRTERGVRFDWHQTYCRWIPTPLR